MKSSAICATCSPNVLRVRDRAANLFVDQESAVPPARDPVRRRSVSRDTSFGSVPTAALPAFFWGGDFHRPEPDAAKIPHSAPFSPKQNHYNMNRKKVNNRKCASDSRISRGSNRPEPRGVFHFACRRREPFVLSRSLHSRRRPEDFPKP